MKSPIVGIGIGKKVALGFIHTYIYTYKFLIP